MTKTDFVAAVAAKANVTKKDAWAIVNAFIEVVMEELANWWKVALTWFWTFEVTKVAERNWVNPSTWEKIKIPAMNRAKFKVWKQLKDAVR